MPQRDARDYPLHPDEGTQEAIRTDREALASQFHACFTQYPEVLAEIRRMGGGGISLLRSDPSGRFDRDHTLIQLGGHELVLLIEGMITVGRAGSEEKTRNGTLQRSAEQEA